MFPTHVFGTEASGRHKPQLPLIVHDLTSIVLVGDRLGLGGSSTRCNVGGVAQQACTGADCVSLVSHCGIAYVVTVGSCLLGPHNLARPHSPTPHTTHLPTHPAHTLARAHEHEHAHTCTYTYMPRPAACAHTHTRQSTHQPTQPPTNSSIYPIHHMRHQHNLAAMLRTLHDLVVLSPGIHEDELTDVPPPRPERVRVSVRTCSPVLPFFLPSLGLAISIAGDV
jgi:hypothetical protein